MFTRTLVPQSAARTIQEMILSGTLKAGEKLPSQRDLSQSLKISRASLREALLTLETLGLLTTRPGSGTFVSKGTTSATKNMARWRYADSYSAAEVFQTRLTIEGRIVELAVQALTTADLEELERSAEAMAKHWAAGDILLNVEADLAFHALIVSRCPNKMLIDLYRSVQDLITETQRQPIPMTVPARMDESIAEHRRILKALQIRDGASAKSEMETHIRNTARCGGIEVL